jgi:NCAIR mutase (PurE)-related protein
MNESDLEIILQQVKSGELDPAEAKRQLQARFTASAQGAAAAAFDIVTEQRAVFPEVIYSEDQSGEEVAASILRLKESNGRVLALRIDAAKSAEVLAKVDGAVYHPTARAITWFGRPQTRVHGGYVAVICDGTPNRPVAEEAALTAECMGSHVERVYDVGTTDIGRLFHRLDVIRGANALVVAAGMDGALVSVVGGLVAVPVIAVPTSTGRGASFGGLAALLAMLNAFAPGVSVVNIDNGFGAGYYAGLINHNLAKRTETRR